MRSEVLAFAAVVGTLFGCGPSTQVVTMYAENNSGETGQATLHETRGGVQIELQLSNSTDVGDQPAHIHSGRCGEIGPVVPVFSGSRAGGTLTPVRAGQSSTLIPGISLAQLGGGKYAINVHFSQDSTLYVACGNIP